MIDKLGKKFLKIIASITLCGVTEFIVLVLLYAFPTRFLLFQKGFIIGFLILFIILTGILSAFWIKEDLKGKIFYAILAAVLTIPLVLTTALLIAGLFLSFPGNL